MYDKIHLFSSKGSSQKLRTLCDVKLIFFNNVLSNSKRISEQYETNLIVFKILINLAGSSMTSPKGKNNGLQKYSR